MPHLCLAGNHDWAALGRLDIRTFNPDARRAVEWTQETLKPENISNFWKLYLSHSSLVTIPLFMPVHA